MNDPSRAYVMTLVSAGCSLAKRATVIDGVVCSTADPPWPSRCAFTPVEITDPEDLLQVLSTVAETHRAVRGAGRAEGGDRAPGDL